MMDMTDNDRRKLAAILGMLGSGSAGERDNAARAAERLRRQLGVTWDEMLEQVRVVAEPAAAAPPPPPPAPPKAPARPAPNWRPGFERVFGAIFFAISFGVARYLL